MLGLGVSQQGKERSAGGCEIREYRKVLHVSSEQATLDVDRGGSNGKGCAVDVAVTRQPLPAELARQFSDLLVDWMPSQGGEQCPCGALLARSHAGKYFKASDLAGVE